MTSLQIKTPWWMVLVVGGIAATGAQAQDRPLRAHVLNVTAEEVFIDAGSRAGVAPGDRGSLEQDGLTLGQVEVTDVSGTSARCRWVGPLSKPPRAGDIVVIVPSFRSVPIVAGGDFIPLLAPKPGTKATAPRPPSDFYGVARLRLLSQGGGAAGSEYALSSLALNSGVVRGGGSSWSFLIDGEASYRSGPGYRDSLDFEEVRGDIYRLVAEGPLGPRGFARVGRFVPAELRSFGYMDGAMLQLNTGNWRWGAQGGVRLAGTEQRPSLDRPTAGMYVGHRLGLGRTRADGTMGVLTDYFKGDLDRLAFLWDERLQLSARTSVTASAEVDKNVLNSTGQPHAQWTRLNVAGRWTPWNSLSLTGGVDRQESGLARPSEGDAAGPWTAMRYLRYWAGAGQSLGAGWRADGDVSLYNSSKDDGPPLWRGGLSKTGLPWMRGGFLNASVYNIDGGGIKGLGTQASAGLPLWRGRFYVGPSARARNAAREGEEKKWRWVDAILRADWRMDPLTVFAGVSRIDSEPSAVTLVESGLETRW